MWYGIGTSNKQILTLYISLLCREKVKARKIKVKDQTPSITEAELGVKVVTKASVRVTSMRRYILEPFCCNNVENYPVDRI